MNDVVKISYSSYRNIIAFKVIGTSLRCSAALGRKHLLECARECCFIYITCYNTYRLCQNDDQLSSFKVLLNLAVFISRCVFILENA